MTNPEMQRALALLNAIECPLETSAYMTGAERRAIAEAKQKILARLSQNAL